MNWNDCKNFDEKANQLPKLPNCNKLFYIDTSQKTNTYKIIFDKWLTSIIFSCFIFLLDIGLALFGFFYYLENRMVQVEQFQLNKITTFININKSKLFL